MKKELSAAEVLTHLILHANDLDTHNRLVLGEIRTMLSRVAHHSIESTAAFLEFQRAHIFLIKHGDPVAKEWFNEASKELRQTILELKKTAKVRGLKQNEIDQVIEQLDDTVTWISRTDVLQHQSSISIPSADNVFDKLRTLAIDNATLSEALYTFQDALHSGDRQAIFASAEELKNAINRGKTGGKFQPRTLVREGLIEEIEKLKEYVVAQLPTADGARAALNFYKFLNNLESSDRARMVFGVFLDDAIRNDPDRWLAICEMVARAKRTTNRREMHSLIFRTMSDLSELLGKNLKAYRQLWRTKLREARLLREQLGKDWKVLTVRRKVKAAAVEGDGFKLFYDDAMFLVNEKDGKAICTLAVQNKSGDRSSKKVIEQINKDILREQRGKILINDVRYTLVAAPQQPPTRVFIGTALPPKEALEGIHFIPLPVQGRDLFSLAYIFLKANLKI